MTIQSVTIDQYTSKVLLLNMLIGYTNQFIDMSYQPTLIMNSDYRNPCKYVKKPHRHIFLFFFTTHVHWVKRWIEWLVMRWVK